jgi:pilus assembly protein Flp/PilA
MGTVWQPGLTHLRREDGQGLVEYALVILGIAIVVIVILTVLGSQLGSTYSSIYDALPWSP